MGLRQESPSGVRQTGRKRRRAGEQRWLVSLLYIRLPTSLFLVDSTTSTLIDLSSAVFIEHFSYLGYLEYNKEKK